MIPRYTATVMPKIQRDILIDHIDFRLPIVTADGSRQISIHVLVEKGLLRYDDPHTPRPRYTQLTERGREVLCIILGDYADALVRTGFLLEHPDVRLPRPVALELPRPLDTDRRKHSQ